MIPQNLEMLDFYLRGQATREETVRNVGQNWVELAERQQQAAMEDLAWAMAQTRQ